MQTAIKKLYTSSFCAGHKHIFVKCTSSFPVYTRAQSPSITYRARKSSPACGRNIKLEAKLICAHAKHVHKYIFLNQPSAENRLCFCRAVSFSLHIDSIESILTPPYFLLALTKISIWCEKSERTGPHRKLTESRAEV